MVQNFRGKEKWVKGEVVQRLGLLTYVVKCGDHHDVYVHIDHMSKGPSKRTEHPTFAEPIVPQVAETVPVPVALPDPVPVPNPVDKPAPLPRWQTLINLRTQILQMLSDIPPE